MRSVVPALGRLRAQLHAGSYGAHALARVNLSLPRRTGAGGQYQQD
jgi:hypothetical protein